MRREDVAFAFLFGSYAKGTASARRSDVDVGVYFKPAGRAIEWEEDREYPKENELWSDVGRIVDTEVDLVVLNRVSVGVAYAAVTGGIPLAINDRALYWRFFLLIIDAGIDFFSAVDDFWRIKERSKSLTEEDAARLQQAIDFLEQQLGLFDRFRDLTQSVYMDAHLVEKKLAVERWVENIVNVSLDIAKLILASEKRLIPGKYREMLDHLGFVGDFGVERASSLGAFAKMRNVLAHEYLDMRFAQIRKFIDEAEPLYHALADFSKRFLAQKTEKK